jgi:hypothetical protein
MLMLILRSSGTVVQVQAANTATSIKTVAESPIYQVK